MYATHLVEKKKIGRFVVRNKFYEHHIPDHILDPILDELYQKNPTSELVKLIMNKRMKTRAKTQKEKTRLVNLLKRKGFVWNDIEPAINDIKWNE